MNEKPKDNVGEQKLESPEDQKYRDFQAAIQEEERIWDEMNKIIGAAPTKEEGQEIALEKYADLMDEALKKSRIAYEEWMNEFKRNQENFERENRGQD